MDQKRLILAIAISVAILVGFQFLLPHAPRPVPNDQPSASTAEAMQVSPGSNQSNTIGATPQDAGNVPVAPPAEVPRMKIAAPRVEGSVSLLGARVDDLVLRDYRETIEPTS